MIHHNLVIIGVTSATIHRELAELMAHESVRITFVPYFEPKPEPVDVQRLVLELCDVPKFTDYVPHLDATTENQRRVPHWQRHNKTPFYATAPRKRRR